MFPLLITMLTIWFVMWAFFKLMYPKPPAAFMPKKGDILTPRACDCCGYPLAEYRGVMEEKPEAAITKEQQMRIKQLQEQVNNTDGSDSTLDASRLKGMSRRQRKAAKLAHEERQTHKLQAQQEIKKITTWFFCNYEHQAQFHTERSQPTEKQQNLSDASEPINS